MEIKRKKKIFKKARNYILEFLKRGLKASDSALTLLNLLNYSEKENEGETETSFDVSELAPLFKSLEKLAFKSIKTFIDEFSQLHLIRNKAVLLDEIKTKILPPEIFLCLRNPVLLGQICLSEELFESYEEEVVIISVAFILLHELCYKKEKIFQRNYPNYKTPEAIKPFKIKWKQETVSNIPYLENMPLIKVFSITDKVFIKSSLHFKT